MQIIHVAFSEMNRRRSEQAFHHHLDDWTLSEWAVALAGEVGEVCNVIKKMNRERDGMPGSRSTVEDLERELADALTYLDLLAQAAGIDLSGATRRKFNEVSLKLGSDILIE